MQTILSYQHSCCLAHIKTSGGVPKAPFCSKHCQESFSTCPAPASRLGAGTMPALAARVQTYVLQKAALLEQPLLECHRAS